MSNIERLHLPGPRERPNDGRGAAIQPVGAANLLIVEVLCLCGLFASWAGFWFAVIWWLFV